MNISLEIYKCVDCWPWQPWHNRKTHLECRQTTPWILGSKGSWNLLSQPGGSRSSSQVVDDKNVSFNSFTHRITRDDLVEFCCHHSKNHGHPGTVRDHRTTPRQNDAPPFQRPTSASSLAPMATPLAAPLAAALAALAAVSSCLRHSSVIFFSCFLARWIMQPTSGAHWAAESLCR